MRILRSGRKFDRRCITEGLPSFRRAQGGGQGGGGWGTAHSSDTQM